MSLDLESYEFGNIGKYSNLGGDLAQRPVLFSSTFCPGLSEQTSFSHNFQPLIKI